MSTRYQRNLMHHFADFLMQVYNFLFRSAKSMPPVFTYSFIEDGHVTSVSLPSEFFDITVVTEFGLLIVLMKATGFLSFHMKRYTLPSMTCDDTYSP